VTVVGGGLSGAAAAIQLVQGSREEIAVTLVEPREALGRGMAYTADDPDHRLNGTAETHSLDPLDPSDLLRWCESSGLFARDPGAISAAGQVFLRRQDFGRYVGDRLREHAHRADTGSTIRHLRDRAVDAHDEPRRVTVRTARGAELPAELVVVATGNAAPRLPALLAGFESHPGVIADPFDLGRIRSLPADARVLLLGSGLTALDIVSTLLRREHRGPIAVRSRRGLRPRPARPPAEPGSKPGPTLLERIEGPVPAFVRAAGPRPTVRALLRALRRRIREDTARGGDWYAAFDDLRDVVWQIWPAVRPGEKRRFHRRLRHWYDAHRFRAPPQNDAMVRAAEREGRVAYGVLPGRTRVEATRDGFSLGDESFDTIVNCTGLDLAAGAQGNPFLEALLARGLATIDPSGVCFAVDAQCRPIGRDGRAHPRLRVIGPPTAGAFGDPLGVPFIVPQVRRIVPGMLATLESAALACP
jgi:uncharacterized NAD(P)/FAD-binding protein YdhS